MSVTMPRNPARSEKIAKRNARIKKLVIEQGKPQTTVAKRYSLTQGAISQIVRNPLSDVFLVRAEV